MLTFEDILVITAIAALESHAPRSLLGCNHVQLGGKTSDLDNWPTTLVCTLGARRLGGLLSSNRRGYVRTGYGKLKVASFQQIW